MTREQIAGELREFISANFPNPSGGALADTTRLMEEWFVDSLAVIEVAMFLERRFKVELRGSDVNAENFENVASLARFAFDRLQDSP